jgi:hypothetical protein
MANVLTILCPSTFASVSNPARRKLIIVQAMILLIVKAESVFRSFERLNTRFIEKRLLGWFRFRYFLRIFLARRFLLPLETPRTGFRLWGRAQLSPLRLKFSRVGLPPNRNMRIYLALRACLLGGILHMDVNNASLVVYIAATSEDACYLAVL